MVGNKIRTRVICSMFLHPWQGINILQQFLQLTLVMCTSAHLHQLNHIKFWVTFQASPDLLHTIWGMAWDVAHHFRPGLKCCNVSGLASNVATFQARPEMLRNVSGQTHSDSWRGWKKQVFWRVFARFLPCCLHFSHLCTYNSDL